MMILYSLPAYYTYHVTSVALNFKHNGMDTTIKEIRYSAEEWNNRSLPMLWRRMGKQASGLFRGSSLQIDHRIRGEIHIYIYLQVGKSVICVVICRTGRCVILPLKWKIFKHRISCSITGPSDVTNGVFTGGNPPKSCFV